MTPSARPVVMIHGAGDNRNVWSGVGDAVVDTDVPWVAFDLPGRNTEDSPHPGSIEGLADFVAAKIVEADLSGIVLAGHSMGSVVVLEVASRIPTRIDHLVLMCTGAPMSVSDRLLEPETPEALHDAVTRYSHVRDAAERFPDALAKHMEEYQTLRNDTFTADLRACNEYGGAVAAAAAATMPATVVLAEHDVMVRVETAEPIIEALGRSQVVMLEGVGHAIEDEAPLETARILVDIARSS